MSCVNLDLSVGQAFNISKADASKPELVKKRTGSGEVGRAQAANRAPQMELEKRGARERRSGPKQRKTMVAAASERPPSHRASP